MIMKLRINNLITQKVLFTLLTLLIVSCEDLLTETPKDRGTVDNYFQTKDDLEQTITATYKMMVFDTWNRGMGGARYRPMFCGADDWTTQSTGNKGDFLEGDQLAISSSNSNISNAGWHLHYDVILQANFSIRGSKDLLEKGLSESELNPKVAEAYAIRAWAYFALVRLYGPVPINLKDETSTDDFALARSPVADVYEQILSDLEFAIAHLPESQPERGRLTRWSAKALRSKVYLTMGGWPLFQNDKYALALTDAQDILQNGPFLMESSFGSMFLQANEETNTEYIWQLKFCGDTDCPGQGLNTPFASQTTKPSEIGGFEDLYIEKSFYNKFPEGARKDFTFLSYLIRDTGDTLKWENFTLQHPFLSKFYDGAFNKKLPYETQSGGSASNAGLDMPLFRITEIMLIYAEAQVVSGVGDNTQALEYLNMVRRRAKGVTPTSVDVDDLVDFTQQDVVDERGWEFVGEMKRWYDLVRTENLANALSDRSPDEHPLIGDPSNKNLYYHPIPDLEMSLNPLLTPNPR